ncbi:hypothetical protein H0H92_011395 [Tricholoma furcatifolium]|nr:hypothetical protein H0H92_011395 [Tricholoma furcatifolium]
MSTSCGNPETEADAIMLRELPFAHPPEFLPILQDRGRPKFDKSKQCVRCKEKTGNIVIRHAVYCKDCFFPLISIKFRRTLDPTVNPLPDGVRRRGLKAGGDLLIGLSGGLGSSVLLDLVYRTYFSFHDAPIDESTGKPRGGKDHPRNLLVWPRGVVCYVETCNAFPGARDRTEDVRAVVEKYEGLTFLPLRIEDAFNRAWWDSVGGTGDLEDLGMDLGNEGLQNSSRKRHFHGLTLDYLALNLLPISDAANVTPADQLQKFISSLPTQTAIPSAVQTLTRMLLLYTASSTGSSHLLLGTSLTSLSVSLISSISQGGGFAVREQAKEEWIPTHSLTRKENGHADGSVRIIYPLQDIGMKECALWAWWRGLRVVGREKFFGGRQSIGPLTKDFIVGLERDYPSTVSTIARTCAKLAPKQGTGGKCLLCERPTQYGLQDWKAQISIRSFKDASSLGSYRPPHFPEQNSAGTAPPQVLPSLTPFLCYFCHTTLTSRSSRGTTAVLTSKDNPVPLPVWITSNLMTLPTNSTNPTTEEGYCDNSEEVWAHKKMDSEEMKAAVADFLLDE